MSFMQMLCKTYDNCIDSAGLSMDKGQAPLLPMCHTILNAYITVYLDESGNFLRADVNDKDTAATISPCTEDSNTRTGPTPSHPLFDKLQYLAGDYKTYVDTKELKISPYDYYVAQLKEWVESSYSHKSICAIYNYVLKGILVCDLIEHKILYKDEQGKLLNKWNGDKNETPPIFKLKTVSPADVVVRFAVEFANEPESKVWKIKEIQKLFIAYTASKEASATLCYVTGEMKPAAQKHPKNIVGTAANAKLISANDTSGFTYRGRFQTGAQVATIGSETTEKAHYVLRWLIKNRGFYNEEQTIVAFGINGLVVPPATNDTDDFFGADNVKIDSDYINEADNTTNAAFSRNINLALSGYRHNLNYKETVVVLSLDCATTGRMSVTYYRVLSANEYLEKIEHWHSTCKWIHRYKYTDKEVRVFEGAPSSKDIVFAAYGNYSEKVRKSAINRLLPCIFDGANIPPDMVLLAVRRVSNPHSFTDKKGAFNNFEWNKALSISCALYKKQHEKEEYQLSLEQNRTDRNYLFGRLLAVFEQIEQMALWEAKEKRETNAMRYMNAFSMHPIKTLSIIDKNLKPYQARLGGKATKYNDLITEIINMFEPKDYDTKNDLPLDGLYLLGYHCQRQVFIDARAAAKLNREEGKLANQNGGENYESN